MENIETLPEITEASPEYSAAIQEHGQPRSSEALIKYLTVQKQREISGNKYKYESLEEEYLAQLPEDQRDNLLGRVVINGEEYIRVDMSDPSALFVAMHKDGWRYPSCTGWAACIR